MASHWVYTSAIMVGLYLMSKTENKVKGTIYILAALCLHFLWNSPLPVLTSVLSTMAVLLFIQVLKEVLTYKQAQALFTEED